ncbi:AAA family ATPase [Clostridium sp. CM027]|uniref:HelD family protein n=1 Tax=Clostridium sp. CM027 TaxID=2849865 RepID=UPI001C6EFB31|nr:UvrD-helicase domain-containing protein [Clostridium sp. CM027]MBW9144739.1 AAA family ATPase [Clostridium sp. CM027]UVE42751.1 AAA family ATPase [Clostridium sp. CM027]
MDASLIEVELKKQLEFNVEEEKLNGIIKIISEEILKYIQKRKEITKYILEYRKKVIEDYRDDEDMVIEYFDHEVYVKEEAFKTIDRRVMELTELKSSPYFGRVDFSEEDYGINKMYVGRFGVTPENTYEPLVVDWRAPVASLFYTGALGEAFYDAPKEKILVNILAKRQFIIKKEKLKGMFDSALDVKDEILQMVLSSNASEKLKDIIMTIQKEQDDLIRQPRTKTIVVDGVAGSGKTTIALHRVAYLLYNYRKILQDKVLILGPNNVFMEYISLVLPSLGESGVKQTTFRDFAFDILGPMEVMSLKEYMEKVLSGEKEFARDIMYKNSTEYKNFLDTSVEKLDNEYFKIEDLLFMNEIVLSKKEIMEMFYNHYKTMPLFRRSKKIKRIIYSKIRDARDEKVRFIQKEYEKSVVELPEEEKDFKINDLDFNRRLKIREVIKEILAVKRNLTWIENGNCVDLYNKINGHKALTENDLGGILYFKIKLEGIKISEEIKHVVIDEAQDYNELQFMVIKELTKCSSLTIVGDSNQRLIPYDGKLPMHDIKNILPGCNTQEFRLSTSYRSTVEIMEYANKYLHADPIVPVVRNGEVVKEKLISDKDELKSFMTQKISEFKSKTYENIAIICKDISETEKIFDLINKDANVKIINKENAVYHSGIVVIPSYFAKGLEFDAVIMILDEPCGLKTEGLQGEYKQEDKLRYVMATRALHELHVVLKSSF